MKVNDYVFTEKYVQKYVRVYIVKLDIYLDSDHRIIITSLHTTMTCKTCRRPKQKLKTKLLNSKFLQKTETKKAFVNAVENFYEITM